MNPNALLALIADLYERVAAETARADRAEQALKERDDPAPRDDG